MSIALLQFMTAAAWAVVALVTTAGTFRLLFRHPRQGDQSKSVFFFTAIVFVGSSSRWLLAPNDLTTWWLVHAISVVLGLYVFVVVWNLRRDG